MGLTSGLRNRTKPVPALCVAIEWSRCPAIGQGSTASESIGSGGFVFVGKSMAPATLKLWIITERSLGHKLQEWYATGTSR